MVNTNYTQSIKSSSSSSRDALIATNIVKEVFYNINLCIQEDRSKVRLNMFEKGAIKGLIGKKTLDGINNYVLNMYPDDIKNLMNGILKSIPKDILESELKKRK